MTILGKNMPDLAYPPGLCTCHDLLRALYRPDLPLHEQGSLSGREEGGRIEQGGKEIGGEDAMNA